MSDVKLCRNRVEFKGSRVVLGIHSTHASDEAGYTDGHAWITVDTEGQRYYLGLWPDGHPRVVNKREDCTDVRLGLENGAPAAASRYYRLNSTQLTALNRIVNRPDVWSYTNNCTNWATYVIEEVLGIDIDSTDYAIFETPRELGRNLLRLEQRSPTTVQFPNADPQGDQMGSSKW